MSTAETRQLVQGGLYLIAMVAPASWTAAQVTNALSSAPPGLTVGTFALQGLTPGLVSGAVSSWHFLGIWYGPTETLPDPSVPSASGVSYPVCLAVTDTTEPLPAPSSLVTWPPSDRYEDVPDLTVVPGSHYLFVFLVPAVWTEDQATATLAANGWDLKSLSSPPTAIAQELAALLAQTSAVPQAFLGNGIWTGSTGPLPPAVGDLHYLALALEGTVVVAPAPSPRPPTPDSSWGTVFLVAGVVVAIVGGLYLVRRPKPQSNPLGFITVDGVSVFVTRAPMDKPYTWCAEYDLGHRRPMRTCARTYDRLLGIVKDDIRMYRATM
jgi:hypothetical protein